MLKNISQLEFKIADKVYRFSCEADSAIDHVKLALSEFQNYVKRFEGDAKAVAEPDSSVQPPDSPKE